MVDIKKTGVVVALFGKPNVGKSTIFNNLQNEVYAIVTHKAQTTRNYLCSKIELSGNQELIVLDTPGFHNPKNKLDMFLNSQVKYALKLSNIVCYVLDPTSNINHEDREILTYIKNLNKKSILIVNKIDLVNDEIIRNKVNEINRIIKFDDQISISAINKLGIDTLKNFFVANCIYEDIEWSYFNNPSDEFLVKEIIREACLLNLNKEVPYGISVITNKFEYNKERNILLIEADIYVEKESQKGIVVGKNAAMIKKIGIESRMKLLEIYDCKIDLRLYVKLKNDWRNDNDLVKLMGYKK